MEYNTKKYKTFKDFTRILENVKKHLIRMDVFNAGI